MSDEDLFDSDESGVKEAPQQVPGQEADWLKAEAERAFAERDKARAELRRMTIQSEYGAEIAELIPEALPPAEWKGFADKLAALRGVQQPNPPAEAKTEEPPGEVEPPAEQLETERRLAAVAGQAPGSAAQAKSDMTAKQIAELALVDPVAAHNAMRAQYADGPSKLPQPFRA